MKKKLARKQKVWKTVTADNKFSKWIRERDGVCIFCGKETQLTCSHYWGRYVSATRYDPENCDTLCMRCHFVHENAKQGYYRKWKMSQLGEDKYNKLTDKYNNSKMTRREAIIEVMELIK